MKKLIVANWKMNPTGEKEAVKLLEGILKSAPKFKNARIIICPPFVYLGVFPRNLKIELGVQDIFYENQGAFTGEISPAMVKSLGVKYAIIGHSERREHFCENNEVVNKKIKAALRNNLKVLFCVGEKERDEKGEYLKFIKKEIYESLNKIPGKNLKNLSIVYEPIWAISSQKNSRATPAMQAGRCGRADTPENFLQTSIYIRRLLFFKFGPRVAHETPVLYGGSVDAGNVADFLTEGRADGVLVGRASWKAESFLKLLKNLP